MISKEEVGFGNLIIVFFRDREYINIVKDCIQQVKEQYMLPIYDFEYIIENEQNLAFQISDQLFFRNIVNGNKGENYFIFIIQKEAK